MSNENVGLILVDEDGSEYDVEASDVEEDEDGSGVWLLAADGEDEEYFYEYEGDDGEDE